MARTTPTQTSFTPYALASILATVCLLADLNYGFFDGIRGFFKASGIYSQLLINNSLDRLQYNFQSFGKINTLIKENRILVKKLEIQNTQDFLNRQTLFKELHLSSLNLTLNTMFGKQNHQIFKLASLDIKNYLCCSSHTLQLLNTSGLDVRKNLPVAADNTLVGQTIGSHLDLIKVILFSDDSHILPVQFGNFFCDAKGEGVPRVIACQIEGVSEDEFKGLGDQVFTSGLGGIYPKEVLVGNIMTIDLIELQDERMFKIMIELIVDPIDYNYFGVIE